MSQPGGQTIRAIGIFGGTFDPIHFGHLRTAVEAMEKLGLTDFRMLPAGTPPHRSGTFAEAGHRKAMLKLALSSQAELVLDDREIRRQGSSFMVDTLAEIRSEQPGEPLLLIIGQDSANALDEWHDWLRLFELAHLIILRRPDSKSVYSNELQQQMELRTVSEARELNQTLSGRVLPLEVTQLAISSTDIRHRIAQGLSPRYLLPETVISYIQEHHLYSEQGP